MPLYEFRCPECLGEEEALMNMADRNKLRLHSCGAVMDKLISIPHLVISKVCGRDTILDTLNGEDKHAKKDGKPVRSKRSQQALARGLDYVRPLEDKVFTGFG